MNNPGADRRGMSSPAPCSGAGRRDKVLDEVSTAFHGGTTEVMISPKILPFLNIFAEGLFSALTGFELCCIRKMTSILVFGGNCGCCIRNPFLSV